MTVSQTYQLEIENVRLRQQLKINGLHQIDEYVKLKKKVELSEKVRKKIPWMYNGAEDEVLEMENKK